MMNEAAAYVAAHRAGIYAMLDGFVRCESCTSEPERVSEMARRFRAALEESGAECRFHAGGEAVGLSVSGVLNGAAEKPPVLLIGHLDTVFPKGAWGEAEFRCEDGRIHAPGCCDMKGGAAAAVWIVRTLHRIGFRDRPVRVAFVSDEETGHAKSDNIAWLRSQAAGAAIALNLEPGRPPNLVTVGRKGCLRAILTVHGREAHSGNAIEAGQNAIEEMADKILKLQALTDLETGTTVSCNLVSGGTVFNCVPGTCRLVADCRFRTGAEERRLRAAIEAVCAGPSRTGAVTEVEFELSSPPFETTEAVLRLRRFADTVSRRYGWGPLEGIQVGGSSDIAHISQLGIPALCSVGIVGGNMHTHDEWADLDSLVRRIQLWTAVILHLDEYLEEAEP